MLLSRFWCLILASAATLGLATAMLSQQALNEERTRDVSDALRRDHWEIERLLRIEARRQLDALAGFAADRALVDALHQANRRRNRDEISEEITNAMQPRLVLLNRQLDELAAELLFIVDSEGLIVGQISPNRPHPGAGLGGFPLVADALRGRIRDDMWMYNDHVYRMAARPIFRRGAIIGALVHGKALNNEFARRLSTTLEGATIGFFRPSAQEDSAHSEIAAAMPSAEVQNPPRTDELAEPASEALLEELEFGAPSETVDLPSGGLAIYAWVTGSARLSGVGYGIGRPVPRDASAFAILSGRSSEDWNSLPWPKLVGMAFGLFLISLLLIWLERDRPLRKLRAHANDLAEGGIDELDLGTFRSHYRKIAESVNNALEKAQSGKASRKKRRRSQSIDDILGAMPEAQNTPADYFGFTPEDPKPAASKKPNTKAPPTTPAKRAVPKPPASPATPPRPPAPPAPPAASAKASAAKPPVADFGEDDLGSQETMVMASAFDPNALDGISVPSLKDSGDKSEEKDADAPRSPLTREQRKKLNRTLLGVGNRDGDEDEDAATTVAQIPQDILNRLDAPDEKPSDKEEAHFRETYEKYIEMKQQCRENVSGLTYERFRGTLVKNRDKIVDKHGAKGVRFRVYEKNGKAALKATPVKD